MQQLHPSMIRPSMIRHHTIPSTQVINDCLVKSHAKLLANYFANMLKINDPVVITQMSVNFDAWLSHYEVEENRKGKMVTVTGYGGFIQDVIARFFIGLKATDPNGDPDGIKALFTQSQIDGFNALNPQEPTIDIANNIETEGIPKKRNIKAKPPIYYRPGDDFFIAELNDFVSIPTHIDPDPTQLPNFSYFVNYITLDFVLTPCAFYWMAGLDNVDPMTRDGYIPNPQLLHYISLEIDKAKWNGKKHVNTTDKNAKYLKEYLIQYEGKTKNEARLIADLYSEYPGHSVLIKGTGTMPDGELCFLVQNSWSIAWNNNLNGSRPIAATFFRMLLYEIVMITPDVHGFGAGFKRRRPNKTNKNKKKPKSPKKGTRKRK